MKSRLDRRTFLRLAQRNSGTDGAGGSPGDNFAGYFADEAAGGNAGGRPAKCASSASRTPQPGRSGAEQGKTRRHPGAGLWVGGRGCGRGAGQYSKEGRREHVWAYTFSYGEARLRTGGGCRSRGLRDGRRHRRVLRLRPEVLPEHDPEGLPLHPRTGSST